MNIVKSRFCNKIEDNFLMISLIVYIENEIVAKFSIDVSTKFKNNDLSYELARVPIKERHVDHGMWAGKSTNQIVTHGLSNGQNRNQLEEDT